jgi:ATP phosphoribosyltransferase
MNTLKLGIPKGSLEKSTCEMFSKAGYKIRAGSRSYHPAIDDPEIKCTLIRAQEMARYVGEAALDCGLTGKDWIEENDADVVEVVELVYGKVGRKPVRWVVAVPDDSDITEAKDLEGKHIATEAVNMTEKYLKKHGVSAKVEFSWGATEVKPPDLADAIVEITETGSSLVANNLRIIDEVCSSTTWFIANPAAYEDEFKRTKIDRIAMLLKAVLTAENQVGLMMNVPRESMDQVIGLLPAIKRPTVSPLVDDGWVALNTIIDEHTVRDLIPALKEAGAEGIVEYPLNKIVE